MTVNDQWSLGNLFLVAGFWNVGVETSFDYFTFKGNINAGLRDILISIETYL